MLIDYHVHNHFSPDSEEETEKIVKKAIDLGIKEICICNHPELYDETTGKDYFNLDEARERFIEIKAELDETQKKFPNIRINFGVELEYIEGWMDQQSQFVKEMDFDFILGSVHVVSGIIISSHKFADELYSQTDEKTAYSTYFNEMMKLIEWGHLDVVAHFDICKKYGSKFYGSFQPEKYKEQIMPILELMKEKGIGLELNTKCMEDKCKEVFPHPTILNWAAQLGIENFTFGSDAHEAKDIGKHFKEALQTAEEAGIKRIATYRKRKPSLSKPG